MSSSFASTSWALRSYSANSRTIARISGTSSGPAGRSHEAGTVGPGDGWHGRGRLGNATGGAGGRIATGRPREVVRRGHAALVSQKISAISSILPSSSSATATSLLPFVPPAPASLVASLNRVFSCGYFSKCGGLK